MDEQTIAKRFPRTAAYNPAWIGESGFGGHPLWQTEWLCQRMDLEPGMRVLDLGCGRVKSSIFLAREFGVEVWAADLWVTASENSRRIKDVGLERRVFPLHADARALPFAGEFFDAIVAVDCYSYFGTDALYLNYLANFVRVGGQLGVAGAGLVMDWTGPMPKHLEKFWSQDCWALQSVATWRRLWERTGIVEIETADAMDEGWRLWSQWHRQTYPGNGEEIEAVEADAGQHLGYVRMVGRRRAGVELADYAWPDGLRAMLPLKEYPRVPMLRAEA